MDWKRLFGKKDISAQEKKREVDQAKERRELDQRLRYLQMELDIIERNRS